jgi:hypothetical protein
MLQWNQKDWDLAKMPLALAKACPENRGLAGRDSTRLPSIQCISVAARQETLWTECLNPGICISQKECCKYGRGGRNGLGALCCRNQSIHATRLRCACLIYYMRMMVSPAFDSARRSQLYGYKTRLSLESSSTIPGTAVLYTLCFINGAHVQ